jgi:uncharacterized protein YkwD
MGLRVRKIALVGMLALTGTGLLALGGPLTSTATASPCGRFGTDMPSKLSQKHARMAMRCLINRIRDDHGLRHLRKNSRLKRAAQGHTRHMRNNRCFDHECPGEPSVLRRLERVNYITGGLRRWMYGENIAYGGSRAGTPRALVRAWMHSPPHRYNILNPQFRHIGIGFSRGTPQSPGRNGSTVTADFGMRKR